MKLSTFLKIHPALTHAADLAEICKPLEDLGIVYFSHVHIDEKNRFSGLGIKPEFFKLYFKKAYYHFDLHKAKEPTIPGEKFVIWDTLPLQKESLELHKDFTSFEQDHTFSLVYCRDGIKDCYHFAAKPSDISANERYLQHLLPLKKFIAYFTDKINRHSKLIKAYDLKIALEEDFGGYFSGDELPFKTSWLANIQPLERFYLNGSMRYVTKREFEVLHWLAMAKTTEEIAIILQITARTVNAHVANMKTRLGCYNQFQLGMMYKELIEIIDR